MTQDNVEIEMETDRPPPAQSQLHDVLQSIGSTVPVRHRPPPGFAHQVNRQISVPHSRHEAAVFSAADVRVKSNVRAPKSKRTFEEAQWLVNRMNKFCWQKSGGLVEAPPEVHSSSCCVFGEFGCICIGVACKFKGQIFECYLHHFDIVSYKGAKTQISVDNPQHLDLDSATNSDSIPGLPDAPAPVKIARRKR